MISYKIASRLSPNLRNSNAQNVFKSGVALDPEQPDYLEQLFKRIISSNQYAKGMRVRLHGTRRKGVIVEIEYEFSKVFWKGKHPYFISVLFDGDTHPTVVSHYHITRKKAK